MIPTQTTADSLSFATYTEDLWGLGPLLSSPQFLTGGLLHHNVLLHTSTGKFVAKKINRQASRTSIPQLQESERIARALKTQGVPAVAALVINDSAVQVVDDAWWLVYDFIPGQSIPPQALSADHLSHIGQVFARVHQADIPLDPPTPQSISPFWAPTDLEAWHHCFANSPLSQLRSLENSIFTWLDLFHRAQGPLNEHSVLSHRDLHYDNVLWVTESSGRPCPFVIDWERAGRVHPQLEVLGYGLEWAGVIRCDFSNTRYQELVTGYATALQSPIYPIDYRDVFYAWLGQWALPWTLLNCQRMDPEQTLDPQEQQRGLRYLTSSIIPALTYIDCHEQSLLQCIEKTMTHCFHTA